MKRQILSPSTAELMDRLLNIVGPKAFKALKNGKAVLKIWRCSTPHNWYIEPLVAPRRFLWHSEEEYSKRVLPPLSLFELVEQSKQVIAPYLYYRKKGQGDVGLEESSTYKLKMTTT